MKRSRGAAGLDTGQEQRSTAFKVDRVGAVDPLACITALQDYERQLRIKAPTKQSKTSSVPPAAAREKLARLAARFAGSELGRRQQWPSPQLQQSNPPQPPTKSEARKTFRGISAANSEQRNVSDWDPVAILLPPAKPGVLVAAAKAAGKALPSKAYDSRSITSSPSSSSQRPCNRYQIVSGAVAESQNVFCPSSPISSSSSGDPSSSPPEQHQINPNVVDLTLDTDTDAQSDSESGPGSDSESDARCDSAADSASAGSEIDADIPAHTDADDDDVQTVDQPAQHSQSAAAAAAAEDPEVSSCTETESCSSDDDSGSHGSDTAEKSEVEDQADSSAVARAVTNTAAGLIGPAAATASAGSSDTSDGSATDSDSTETSSDTSSSSGSSSDDGSGSDGEWAPNRPEQHSSRQTITDQIDRSVARRLTATDSPSPSSAAARRRSGKLAAAAEAEQVTPPNCNASANKQQQQQQEDETPVLTEQQRIKAASDCKSPGTPQILLLPCCLIGSSSSGGQMSTAAGHDHHQQQQVERDANGRRVLGEVQAGQIRGLVTPRSKTKIEISKQQQKVASDSQTIQSSSTAAATPVKSGNPVASTAAAAPSTPEILKFQHTPQQQQQKQQQQQQQQEEEDWMDTEQCKDNRQRQQQQQLMTPKAVTAAAAAAGSRLSPQQQAAQLASAHQVNLTATAAAGDATASGAVTSDSFADKPSGSSSTSAAVAVRQCTPSSLSSPLKPPAAVCPKLAPGAAAAAVTPAAAAAACAAAVAPPLSDCRTMSYVRTPRQPGIFKPGITKKAIREAAALAYQEAATSAYNSGSNPNWSNSSSSTPLVSRHATVNAILSSLGSSSSGSSSAAKPEGAGHLSIKPTLEQRVQCAYLRMRLTEAAAAGASWAVLDLAGLPVDDSDDAMEDCRQKYAAERSILLKCRSLTQVAAEDKRSAAAFSWIKKVRQAAAAAAAAQSSEKQGLLKRISPLSSLPQWQLSGPIATARQQQRPCVRFSDEVQEFPVAPRAAAETSV